MRNDYGDRTVVTITRFLKFFYDGYYQIGLPDHYEQTLGHILMYAIAERYDVPSLKDYALHQYSRVATWTEEMLIDLLPVVYEYTSTSDRKLKDHALKAARSHLDTLLPILMSQDCNEDLRKDCGHPVIQHVGNLRATKDKLQRQQKANQHAWKIGSYQRTWNAALTEGKKLVLRGSDEAW